MSRPLTPTLERVFSVTAYIAFCAFGGWLLATAIVD